MPPANAIPQTEESQRLQQAVADRYRVLRELGAGGMATVYLAEDLRHHRDVALKVLRPEIAATFGAGRFAREIDVIARLQHPNILPLIDSGEAAGAAFYVMPFVEGESLRDRLAREKQLPVDDAVRIAREVADALSYAHARGVIHRDIKPENVLLQSGHAVLADFGIALAVTAVGATRLTETGLAPGTPAYMSPEQAAGAGDLDGRTDVYSLGCMLYEMLAGEPPFTGPTAQVILARKAADAVPSLRLSRETVSEALEAVIAKALARVPADRFASAAAFVAALTDAEAAPGLSRKRASAPAAPRRTPARLLRAAAAAAVPLAVAAALWVWLRPAGGGEAKATATTIVLPDTAPLAYIGTAPYGIARTALALAPDGSVLAYVAARGRSTQIYLRPMDRDTVYPVAGTEGACCPFFSPDGAWLAFIANDVLMRVRVGFAGAPLPIIPVSGFTDFAGADWGDDGRVFVTDQQGARSFWVLPGGGETEPVRPPIISPRLIPGSKAVLSRRSLVTLARRESHPLLPSAMDPRYVPTGHVAFGQGGRLWAVPFDPGRLRVTGEPFPVLDGLRFENGGAAQYAFSHSGLLVYARGASAALARLVAVHPSGRVDRLPFDPAVFGCMALSGDGTRLAVVVVGSAADRPDLWVYDLAGGTRVRLVSDVGESEARITCPAWSPDGRVTYFASRQAGAVLVSLSATGRESPAILRQLDSVPERITVYGWSPDGQAALVTRARDLLLVPRDSARPIRPVAATPALEWGGGFSPDGHWIAYSSDESGIDEIYVQPYPPNGRRWRVSRDGGEEPQWTQARELVYRRGQEWWSVHVAAGAEFTATEPVLKARGPYLNVSGVEYAVSGNGDVLYLLEPVTGPPTTTQLTVVTNWFAALRELSRRAGR